MDPFVAQVPKNLVSSHHNNNNNGSCDGDDNLWANLQSISEIKTLVGINGEIFWLMHHVDVSKEHVKVMLSL
jgi:hypothetical protein